MIRLICDMIKQNELPSREVRIADKLDSAGDILQASDHPVKKRFINIFSSNKVYDHILVFKEIIKVATGTFLLKIRRH